MTLKKKFNNVEVMFESQTGTLKYDELCEASNQCEKIADDYAIEFAEWCDDNYFKNGKGNSNWSASMDWDDDEKFTTKELLEIFKKEKGL